MELVMQNDFNDADLDKDLGVFFGDVVSDGQCLGS